MSAESVAYSLLTADGAVAALVSTRVYPDFIPQERDLPAVAVTRTETEYITTIHAGTPQAILATIEIWCLASTRLGAENLADAVIDALTGSPGGFMPQGRRPEFEAGPPEQHATVLTMQYWEL